MCGWVGGVHVYVCARVHVCVCVWLVGNMETKQKLSNSGGLGDPKKKQPDRDGW